MMELRSRSRSKTPLQTQSFIEAEAFAGSNHVSVTRSTRRTTTVRTMASGGSNEFSSYESTSVKPVRNRSTKSTKAVIKTSDYSSEEGEFENSQVHLSENERNQLIEDARAAANGTAEVSALNLYRRAGRYWDKYPKTDYTYSRHSRDRVELAPGVVQMPNMSRRTIHSDSATNTDSYYSALKSHLVKQRLFSSPNNNDEVDKSFKIYRSSSSTTRRHTVLSVITSIFTRIYIVLFWCLYTVYHTSNSTMIYFGKKLHHLASKVMLLDTWLLKKSTAERRTKAILVLCLLPLLFFAGVHVLLASGVSLAPFCHPHCGRYISTYYNSFINAASNVFQ